MRMYACVYLTIFSGAMFSGAAAGARNVDLPYTLRSLHNALYRVPEDMAGVLLQQDVFEEASRDNFCAMSYLRHRIRLLFQLAMHTRTPPQSRKSTPTSWRTLPHHAAWHTTGEEEEGDREGDSRRNDSAALAMTRRLAGTRSQRVSRSACVKETSAHSRQCTQRQQSRSRLSLQRGRKRLFYQRSSRSSPCWRCVCCVATGHACMRGPWRPP